MLKSTPTITTKLIQLQEKYTLNLACIKIAIVKSLIDEFYFFFHKSIKCDSYPC